MNISKTDDNPKILKASTALNLLDKEIQILNILVENKLITVSDIVADIKKDNPSRQIILEKCKNNVYKEFREKRMKNLLKSIIEIKKKIKQLKRTEPKKNTIDEEYLGTIAMTEDEKEKYKSMVELNNGKTDPNEIILKTAKKMKSEWQEKTSTNGTYWYNKKKEKKSMTKPDGFLNKKEINMLEMNVNDFKPTMDQNGKTKSLIDFFEDMKQQDEETKEGLETPTEMYEKIWKKGTENEMNQIRKEFLEQQNKKEEKKFSQQQNGIEREKERLILLLRRKIIECFKTELIDVEEERKDEGKGNPCDYSDVNNPVYNIPNNIKEIISNEGSTIKALNEIVKEIQKCYNSRREAEKEAKSKELFKKSSNELSDINRYHLEMAYEDPDTRYNKKIQVIKRYETIIKGGALFGVPQSTPIVVNDELVIDEKQESKLLLETEPLLESLPPMERAEEIKKMITIRKEKRNDTKKKLERDGESKENAAETDEFRARTTAHQLKTAETLAALMEKLAGMSQNQATIQNQETLIVGQGGLHDGQQVILQGQVDWGKKNDLLFKKVQAKLDEMHIDIQGFAKGTVYELQSCTPPNPFWTMIIPCILKLIAAIAKFIILVHKWIYKLTKVMAYSSSGYVSSLPLPFNAAKTAAGITFVFVVVGVLMLYLNMWTLLFSAGGLDWDSQAIFTYVCKNIIYIILKVLKFFMKQLLALPMAVFGFVSECLEPIIESIFECFAALYAGIVTYFQTHARNQNPFATHQDPLLAATEAGAEALGDWTQASDDIGSAPEFGAWRGGGGGGKKSIDEIMNEINQDIANFEHSNPQEINDLADTVITYLSTYDGDIMSLQKVACNIINKVEMEAKSDSKCFKKFKSQLKKKGYGPNAKEIPVDDIAKNINSFCEKLLSPNGILETHMTKIEQAIEESYNKLNTYIKSGTITEEELNNLNNVLPSINFSDNVIMPFPDVNINSEGYNSSLSNITTLVNMWDKDFLFDSTIKTFQEKYEDLKRRKFIPFALNNKSGGIVIQKLLGSYMSNANVSKYTAPIQESRIPKMRTGRTISMLPQSMLPPIAVVGGGKVKRKTKKRKRKKKNSKRRNNKVKRKKKTKRKKYKKRSKKKKISRKKRKNK